LFIDGVPMDVLFSESDLSRNRLPLGDHRNELNFSSCDVVVVSGGVLVALDFQVHKVSEHFLILLASSTQNVVVLASLD
jgi:hypothetical protein